MMSAGWSFPAIQRFGRWSSDAFQGYLWDTVEASGSLAKDMISAPGTLHVGAFLPPTEADVNRVSPIDVSRVWHNATVGWRGAAS